MVFRCKHAVSFREGRKASFLPKEFAEEAFDIIGLNFAHFCVYTYIYHKNQPNVGEYTSPMDGMGQTNKILPTFERRLFPQNQPQAFPQNLHFRRGLGGGEQAFRTAGLEFWPWRFSSWGMEPTEKIWGKYPLHHSIGSTYCIFIYIQLLWYM